MTVYHIIITAIGYFISLCLYIMILIPIKKIIKKEYTYRKFTYFPVQLCFFYSVSWVVFSVQNLLKENSSTYDEFWLISLLVTNIMGCWSSFIISLFYLIYFSQKKIMYGVICLLGILLAIIGYIIAAIFYISKFLFQLIIGWNVLLLIAIGVDDVHFLISNKNKNVNSIKNKKIYQIIPGLINTIFFILFPFSKNDFNPHNLDVTFYLTFLIPNGLGCLLFIVEIILLIKQKRAENINQTVSSTGIVSIHIDESYFQRTLNTRNNSDSGVDDSMCDSNNS